ncbi:MAG: flagellar biosynthesis regulator FlaF [Pseudomonadota bacterium]
MPANPLDAYQSVEKSTLSGRELEASVLAKAAVRLQEVQQSWSDPDHETRLDEALKFNQRVWSFFQSEVSQPDNPLPPEIKQNILSLSVFVDKRIFEVMAYPSPEKLDILININRNIAAGLRGDPD